MKVTILHFFCLLAVCAAQEGTVLPYVLEGEDFRHSFSIDIPSGERQIYLCRLPCGPGDMLMQVHGRRTKSGRYNLRLDGQVHVAITRVNKQDSGFYRVGVTSDTSEQHKDFQLIVKDLCEGGVDRSQNREYLVSPGSDLTVLCELSLQPSNRKFLCREDCSAFLIDTNDHEGHSSKYGLQYVSRTSFRATIKNLSLSDAGTYRCGKGCDRTGYHCQEFTVRVNEASPKNVNEA